MIFLVLVITFFVTIAVLYHGYPDGRSKIVRSGCVVKTSVRATMTDTTSSMTFDSSSLLLSKLSLWGYSDDLSSPTKRFGRPWSPSFVGKACFDFIFVRFAPTITQNSFNFTVVPSNISALRTFYICKVRCFTHSRIATCGAHWCIRTARTRWRCGKYSWSGFWVPAGGWDDLICG